MVRSAQAELGSRNKWMDALVTPTDQTSDLTCPRRQGFSDMPVVHGRFARNKGWDESGIYLPTVAMLYFANKVSHGPSEALHFESRDSTGR